MKILYHSNGWNGGCWKLNNRPARIDVDLFNRLAREWGYLRNQPNKVLKAHVMHGEDHDMGHTYAWKAVRIREEVAVDHQIYSRNVGRLELPDDFAAKLIEGGAISWSPPSNS